MRFPITLKNYFVCSSPPSTPGRRPRMAVQEEEKSTDSNITFIPFPFDLTTLLPRSQQAELLFSTFVVGAGKSWLIFFILVEKIAILEVCPSLSHRCLIIIN